jgi:hypothetical protein
VPDFGNKTVLVIPSLTLRSTVLRPLFAGSAWNFGHAVGASDVPPLRLQLFELLLEHAARTSSVSSAMNVRHRSII